MLAPEIMALAEEQQVEEESKQKTGVEKAETPSVTRQESLKEKVVQKVEEMCEAIERGWEESVKYESGEALSPDTHTGALAGAVVEKAEAALEKFEQGWEDSVKYESGEALSTQGHGHVVETVVEKAKEDMEKVKEGWDDSVQHEIEESAAV